MSDPLLYTRIWQEEPEAGNPFAARVARCHGYDVYGEMLGRARWVDMLYLLFTGEPPSLQQAALLEHLAVALANPGVREPSVHAAMCGGVSGNPAAACLMAALAVGAGRVDGARDVYVAMQAWHGARHAPDTLPHHLAASVDQGLEIWPEVEHWPGFDPHGQPSPTPVRQTLAHLAAVSPGDALPWLNRHRELIESEARAGLNFAGVAAAAYVDLGLTPEQGETIHLLLRLPGAAAHALEQRTQGYKKFPFGDVLLMDDPHAPAQQSESIAS